MVSVLIVLQSVGMVANNVFVGTDRMDRNALIMVLQSLVKLVVAPLLIVLGFGVVGALVGHIMSYVVGVLVALVFLLPIYREYRHSSGSGDFRVGFTDGVAMMIRYGFPIYFSGLLMSFVAQYGMLVMAWFVTDFEIGNYRAASNFLSILGVLMVPVSTALFPAFSKFRLEDERGLLREFFGYSQKYVFLLLFPSVLFLLLVSRDLVFLLYGSEYVLAPVYLCLLSAMYLFNGLVLIVLSFFNGVGLPGFTVRAVVAYCVVAVPLIYVLTMWYGVVGLIIGTAVGWFVSLVYGEYLVVKLLGGGLDLGSFPRIFVAGVVSAFLAGVVVRLFSFPVLGVVGYLVDIGLVAVVFVPSYLVLVPLLGGICGRDIKVLQMIFGRIRYVGKVVEFALRFEEVVLRAVRRI